MIRWLKELLASSAVEAAPGAAGPGTKAKVSNVLTYFAGRKS